MRFAVAALCVLALTGSAEAAGNATYCLDTKALETVPRSVLGEPSVKWQVFHVRESKLRSTCGYTGPRIVHSCTFPADGYWAIIMPNNISLDEYACRLAYEKAHMPPNYWADPKVELPATIKWLEDQKRASR